MHDGSEKQIESIPDDAKVTFAKINPQGKGFEPYALRIYTSANNQLACLLNVAEFYDTSLTVLKRVVKKAKGSSLKTADKDGFETSNQSSVEYGFIED